MKNSDIEIMANVLVALKNYLPTTENKTFIEFQEMYERFYAKNQKEKQNYQNRAEYHRDYSRSWKAENPEKQKEYQVTYRAKNPEKQKKYQAGYYARKTAEKKNSDKQSLSDKAEEKPSIYGTIEENKKLITHKEPSEKQKTKEPEL